MTGRPHPSAPGALPRDLAAGAAVQFGRALVVEWCEELLAGRATDVDSAWPDIAWLGGAPGRPPDWARTWGARGLVHIGPPARPVIVLSALDDESWRVREMALKVIRRHGLDIPDAAADRLVRDPAERVCIQACTTLGVPVPYEQHA